MNNSGTLASVGSIGRSAWPGATEAGPALERRLIMTRKKIGRPRTKGKSPKNHKKCEVQNVGRLPKR